MAPARSILTVHTSSDIYISRATILLTVGAHAQIAMATWSVCVCVCLRLFPRYGQQSGWYAIPTALVLQALEKIKLAIFLKLPRSSSRNWQCRLQTT